MEIYGFVGEINPNKDLYGNDEKLLNFPRNGYMKDGKVFSLGIPTAAMSKLNRKFAEGIISTTVDHAQMFPTPQASDWKNKNYSRDYTLGNTKYLWPTPRAGNPGSRPNKKGGRVLAEEVKKSLWATPITQEIEHPNMDITETGRRRTRDGKNSHSIGLADQVHMFPTPGTTGLSNGSGNCESINRLYQEGKITEEERRSMRSGNGGQLYPGFVEALMGYPQGWSDIDKEDVPMDVDFPASWLAGTWEDGIPRIKVGIKNRNARLRCLGNAVVPQIPEMIWLSIKQHLVDKL